MVDLKTGMVTGSGQASNRDREAGLHATPTVVKIVIVGSSFKKG
jgi:hypothetical protein